VKNEQRHWTLYEIDELRERYPTTDTRQIARDMGRSITGVQRKAQDLGLRKVVPQRGGSFRRWSDEDLEFLREHYATMITDTLAKKLGRSVRTVYSTAAELGLRKDRVTTDAMRSAAMRAKRDQARAAKQKKLAPKRPARTPLPPVVTLTEAQIAHRKRLQREAIEKLVEHGIDEHQAELATHLIVRKLVPGLRFDL
jgi:hypothetical protein